MNQNPETLNERLYAEEPVIAGRQVRPWNQHAKFKMARILRWLEGCGEQEKNEELVLAFLYLIAAPIERVSLNVLNRTAYFVDKDAFIGSLSEEDLRIGGDWFLEVSNLEAETSVEVVPKPGGGSGGESAPPNS